MKRGTTHTLRAFLVALSVLGAKPGHASEPGVSGLAGSPASDAAACAAAVRFAERKASLPPLLLGAISMAESGRTEPQTRRFGAWPWTINVAGKDFFFDTKREAIAAVVQSQVAGVRSIDVGCMQVNLMHHPNAFPSLDQAFDPWINADYAADFLGRLRVVTGDWASATAAYHSMTPELGAEYQRHVAAFLPEGSRYGLSTQAMPAILVGPRTPPIDPYDVMTPEFKARLRQDTADRNARNATFGPRDTLSVPRHGAIPVRTVHGAPLSRQARAGSQTRVF